MFMTKEGISRTRKSFADTKEELAKVLEKPSDKYRRFPLVKKSGGVRWISEPVYQLKLAQKTVLDNMEIPEVTQSTSRGTHSVITGFIPGTSILDNARPHVGKKVVLSMDLKDFFGSIRFKDLIDTGQRGFGLQSLMSIVDMVADQPFWSVFREVCFTNKGLPQGSPCSPMLANWAARRGDELILKELSFMDQEISYTRYADDLTFSGDNIPEEFVQWLTGDTSRIFFPRARFAHNKIKFMRSHKRQLVTGIIVNEKLSIPRERRMKLRAIRHRIETRGIDSVENYNFHEIMGELSYLHLTDKEKARNMIDMLLAL